MVFLSHSWHDKPVARRVVEEFSAEGIPCWLDEQQLDYGEGLRAALRRAISQSHVYLYLVSEAANESRWVQDELEHAVNLETESGLRIVPVRLTDSKASLPSLLSGRVYASLDPMQGGLAQLAQSLSEIREYDHVPDGSRISATVRLAEHGLVHTLGPARVYKADCERHVLLIDNQYESLSKHYWEVSEVKFPPIDTQAIESPDIAETVRSVHTQCRRIIRESMAVCRRFSATDSRSDDCNYFDAGHERILHEMLHRLKSNTKYLRHLRGDEAFDQATLSTRSLPEPFDGPTCDLMSDGRKIGSVKVPEYARSDTSMLFGRLYYPFASVFAWDVGKAICHILARRFMAETIQSTEMPAPDTMTYGPS